MSSHILEKSSQFFPFLLFLALTSSTQTLLKMEFQAKTMIRMKTMSCNTAALPQVTKQEAIRQNNNAVAMMKSGNYQQAICEFSNALKYFRGLLALSHGQEQELKINMDQCMTQSQPTLGDGQPYLYDHGIKIPPAMVCIGNQAAASIMCSSMIVFNLALAYQLSATKCATSKQSLLSRAGRLYEVASKVQQELAQESNVIFALAICNNLGIVHAQLQDNERSIKCFQHLLSMLMIVTTRSGPQEYCLDGFLESASFLNFLASAAAAA